MVYRAGDSLGGYALILLYWASDIRCWLTSELGSFITTCGIVGGDSPPKSGGRSKSLGGSCEIPLGLGCSHPDH